MARGTLTVNNLSRSGNDITTMTAADATNGHAFDNDGNVFIVVRNGGAGSITVTVQTPRTVDDLAVADLTVSIAAGKTYLIGPFPTETFNQSGSDRGKVYVDFDTDTSVALGAYKMT